jgi:hypothetical protein
MGEQGAIDRIAAMGVTAACIDTPRHRLKLLLSSEGSSGKGAERPRKPEQGAAETL